MMPCYGSGDDLGGEAETRDAAGTFLQR